MRRALAWAILLVGACSGGDKAADSSRNDGGSPVGTRDTVEQKRSGRNAACDVLDKTSVDAAMGRDAGQPKATGDSMCQYLFEGDRIMDQGMVSLIIHDVSLASLEPGLREMKSAMTPMDGIGDRALWTDYGLYVEHGGRSGIYVAGQGTTDEAANKAKTIALAKATANKL